VLVKNLQDTFEEQKFEEKYYHACANLSTHFCMYFVYDDGNSGLTTTCTFIKNLIYLFLCVIYSNKFYILISSSHLISSKVMFVQNNGNKS
jgi:hypothetical protein